MYHRLLVLETGKQRNFLIWIVWPSPLAPRLRIRDRIRPIRFIIRREFATMASLSSKDGKQGRQQIAA